MATATERLKKKLAAKKQGQEKKLQTELLREENEKAKEISELLREKNAKAKETYKKEVAQFRALVKKAEAGNLNLLLGVGIAYLKNKAYMQYVDSDPAEIALDLATGTDVEFEIVAESENPPRDSQKERSSQKQRNPKKEKDPQKEAELRAEKGYKDYLSKASRDPAYKNHPLRSEVAQLYFDLAKKHGANQTAYGKKMAFKWCRRAARENHPEALYMYGHYYFAGTFLPRNLDNSKGCYLLAQKMGYSPIGNILAMISRVELLQEEYSPEEVTQEEVQQEAEEEVLGEASEGDRKETGEEVQRDVLEETIQETQEETLQEVEEDTLPQIIIPELSKEDQLALALEKEDANALYQLGLHFEFSPSKDRKKDDNLAFEAYQKAAKLKHPKAISSLARLYEFGFSVDQNIKKALALYEKAAQLGDPNADFWLGELYRYNTVFKDKKDPDSEKKAFVHFQKAAEKGHGLSQLKMGIFYNHGFCEKEDLRKALFWFKKAAEQGVMYAHYFLGLMYRTGEGCEIDLKKAREYFEMAEKNNIFFAKRELGRLFILNEGEGMDPKRAHELLWAAAKAEDPEAHFLLGTLYMGDYDYPKDEKKAFEWMQKAAEKKLSKAVTYLGDMYCRGIGTKQNVELGSQWLEKAAKQDDPIAMMFLAELYSEEKVMPKDYVKANHWLMQATKFKEPLAFYNLGINYYAGNGCKKDWKESIKWFKGGAALNHEHSQYELGTSFLVNNGSGVTIAPGESLEWIQKAAKGGNACAVYILERIKGVMRNPNELIPLILLLRAEAETIYKAPNGLVRTEDYASLRKKYGSMFEGRMFFVEVLDCSGGSAGIRKGSAGGAGGAGSGRSSAEGAGSGRSSAEDAASVKGGVGAGFGKSSAGGAGGAGSEMSNAGREKLVARIVRFGAEVGIAGITRTRAEVKAGSGESVGSGASDLGACRESGVKDASTSAADGVGTSAASAVGGVSAASGASDLGACRESGATGARAGEGKSACSSASGVSAGNSKSCRVRKKM